MRRQLFVRIATVMSALGAVAACSVQAGHGVLPVALQPLLGSNGLLAAPSALEHHPAGDITVLRWDAARLVGVATPAERPQQAVLDRALADLDRSDALPLRVMWALDTANEQGVSAALQEVVRTCRARGKAAPPRTCPSLVARVRQVLLTHGEKSELAALAPVTKAPPCPKHASTLDEEFAAALCGGDASHAAFDDALRNLAAHDGYLEEPETLWLVAAIAGVTHERVDDVRDLVRKSLAQTTVEGLFVDATRPAGTLLSSWAMLYVAARDGRTTRSADYVRAVREAETDNHVDRLLLQRANLDLLGVRDAGWRLPSTMRLTDPDGIYNPFLALAAEQLGVQDQVQLGVPRSAYAADPTRLASAVTTRFLLTRQRERLTSAQASALQGLAENRHNPYGLRILALVALRIGGATDSVEEPVADHCDSVPWMLSASAEDRTCDLRASMTMAVSSRVDELLPR